MRKYEHGGDIFAEERKILDFSVNINPLGMPQHVRDAALYAVEHETSYPDPFCRKLTAALSGRYGLLEENIVCGNGASDLILRLCAAVRPEKVLVPAPGFSEYARSAALFNAEIFEYAAGPFRGQQEAGGLVSAGSKDGAFLPLKEALSEYRPNIVFICRPNNPDGSLVGLDELRDTAEFCKQIGAILAVDECFLEFTGATSALALLDRFSNVLVLNAFTKTYALAGLRLGFMFAADTGLLDRIYSFGTPWSVSAPAQASGAACCEETAFLSKSRRYITEERKRLVSAFESYGLKVFPSEANFLLVKAAEGPAGKKADTKNLRQALSERGIRVRDCRSFTGLSDSYIRVGVRTTEENSALISALEDIYG
ncbi:MAG: pyridoxal phosphate-dependent class II aminotransferase [Firmicutes bacterium]|nr:pyridoxal phosphate-dependent class II aminotransferase [Bacillota bacterium]